MFTLQVYFQEDKSRMKIVLKPLVHHIAADFADFMGTWPIRGDLLHNYILFTTRYGSMRHCIFKNPWIWTLCTNEPTSSSLPNYKRERWVMKCWIRTMWTKYTSSEPFLTYVLQPTRFQNTLDLYFPKPIKSRLFSWNDLFNITDINILRKTGSGIVFVAVLCYNITQFSCWQCRLAFSFPDH